MLNGGRSFWWIDHATDQQVRQLGKAVLLAPTLQVCEALLRGETVPIGKLDPEWFARLKRT